jgi:hypothetical protein
MAGVVRSPPRPTNERSPSRSGILSFRRPGYEGMSGFQKCLTRGWKLTRIRHRMNFNNRQSQTCILTSYVSRG